MHLVDYSRLQPIIPFNSSLEFSNLRNKIIPQTENYYAHPHAGGQIALTLICKSFFRRQANTMTRPLSS